VTDDTEQIGNEPSRDGFRGPATRDTGSLAVRRYRRARTLKTATETALLLAVAAATEPVGARSAARALRQEGFELSESTLARMLRRLDERGLTHRIGAKGRLPTNEGRRLAALLESDRRRSEEFAAALDISSVHALLDLLRVRRGLEAEAARAAAENAKEEDLARLRQVVEEHAAQSGVGEIPRHSGLEFHRLVARASGNALLAAIAETVLAEETAGLEQVLDIVTKSAGTFDRSLVEHIRLLERFEAGDPSGAARAMEEHLTRLIDETSEFAGSERSAQLDRLLALVRPQSTVPSVPLQTAPASKRKPDAAGLEV
jgi:DNA-binding FadR family transcriptional regulator